MHTRARWMEVYSDRPACHHLLTYFFLLYHRMQAGLLSDSSIHAKPGLSPL